MLSVAPSSPQAIVSERERNFSAAKRACLSPRWLANVSSGAEELGESFESHDAEVWVCSGLTGSFSRTRFAVGGSIEDSGKRTRSNSCARFTLLPMFPPLRWFSSLQSAEMSPSVHVLISRPSIVRRMRDRGPKRLGPRRIRRCTRAHQGLWGNLSELIASEEERAEKVESK